MAKRLFESLRIAEEGKRFIFTAFFACVLLSWIFPAQYLFFIAAFIFFLFFFRDPVRNTPDNASAVVSPADGRIKEIDFIAVPGFENRLFRRIGILLSIFDVHVQRFPYSGEVKKIEYKKGRFLPAASDNASVENESNLVLIRTDSGPIAVRQIAGLAARRIVCTASVGNKVARGEKMGIIMFGSRVELYLPADSELLVKKGDRVIAGVTSIGIIR